MPDLETRGKAKILFCTGPGRISGHLLNWVSATGWCRGIVCKHGCAEEDLKRMRALGLDVVLSMKAHPETYRRQYVLHGSGDLPDIEEMIRRCTAAAGGDVSKVKWELLVEEDSSGVSFPQKLLRTKPQTHGEAQRLWINHIAEAIEQAAPYPDVELWAINGYASSAHAVAATRVAQVNLERTNEDIDDLQTGIAFCRGAARQYGKRWAIEFSAWWGPAYGGGSTTQRLSPSFHRRSHFISFFSGSNNLIMEGFGGQAPIDPKALPPLGEAVREIGEFSLRIDPGTPDVPVAIMLPPDNGWITRPYWDDSRSMWNVARLPCRMGDRGIDGFFGTAFPGSVYAMEAFPFGRYVSDDPPASPFALSCISPEFAVEPTDAYCRRANIPFGKYENRLEAQKALIRDQADIGLYRPAGTSRWGDIFDVLTTDAALDVVRQYPVLILLGAITLTPELKRRLADYVTEGGSLVWSVGVVGPGDTDLTGVVIGPEFRVGRAWRWGGEVPVHEAFHYLPATIAHDADTETLAATPSGEPLVIRRRQGRGTVYTCLLPWFEAGHTDLAGLARRLMDEVIGAVQPVVVDGLPVEWVSTRGPDHRTVLVANHDHYPWTGTVTLRGIDDGFSGCRDLISDESLAYRHTDGDVKIPLTIPAYDLAIVRIAV